MRSSTHSQPQQSGQAYAYPTIPIIHLSKHHAGKEGCANNLFILPALSVQLLHHHLGQTAHDRSTDETGTVKSRLHGLLANPLLLIAPT
jgi:hypothetical protein